MQKKISIIGSDHIINTLPRIKEGFIALDYIIDNDNPDFIFCNDPPFYKEAVALKQIVNKPLILNVLDVPTHVPEIKILLSEWSQYLSACDRITSISQYTQSQVKTLTGFDSTVIYNPIKDVKFSNSPRDKFSLAVGRVNDVNKRFYLCSQTIDFLANSLRASPESLLNIVGTENPLYGNYVGMVSDDKLNDLYNTTEFIFITSKIEGICLPLIESMICGCIPIVCNDMTTSTEFAPKELLVNPNCHDILMKMMEILKDVESYRKLVINHSANFIPIFDKINIAKNIERVYYSLYNE